MDANAYRADGDRVLADLYELRRFGTYETGVHRPTFSDAHLQSLAWLRRKLKAAVLAPITDGMGNVFGRSEKAGRKLLCGSHLESQNHAGWLDGPLGVVYALEAARVLNSQPAPFAVEVACWCDEEGHFGSMLGSRSFVGDVAEVEIDAARDRTSGRMMRDALASAGLAGVTRARAEPGRYIGYLEAHIEQGDVLENAGLAVGVVSAIVGIWQYEITFTGQQNHAGTTSMASRRDAGLALAKFCVSIDQRFPSASGPRTVWTTGRNTLDPGAPSIIPGSATMLFQIRDTDPKTVVRLEHELQDLAAEATTSGPCTVAIRCLRVGKPAMMDAGMQAAIAAASETWTGGRHMTMPSGAGHDAQMLARVMPAGMLFVPSIGGISHHWTENTADDDITHGADVFVSACARLLSDASSR